MDPDRTDPDDLDVTQAATGEVVAGRYQLGALLGRGGMGEVRAARDLTLGRNVAVKLLHYGLAGDERVSRRFEHEALAAARLTHPNVVRVYDAGSHDGRPFIVMERLDGGTLSDEIARGPLPEERVREVGGQLLEALAAAHKHGVLHRDVKPSNVLIAPDGSVRVGDFGIAKTELASDGTTTGMVLGTLGYLPPERLQGKPATAASDTYAAGVVLYEALTGRRPFVGDNPVAVLASVQRGTPPSLDELRPDVDPALRAAVRRSMALDPAERFASASDFARAVRDARTDTDATREQAPVDTSDHTAVMPVPQPAASAATQAQTPPKRLAPPPPRAATPRAPQPRADVAVAEPRRRRASVARVIALLVALAVIGAAIGAGIGLLIRDDSGTPTPAQDATTVPADPVEAAMRALEQAVSR